MKRLKTLQCHYIDEGTHPQPPITLTLHSLASLITHNHSSHHLSPPSSSLYPSPQPLTPPPSHRSTTPPLNPFTLHPSSCTGPQEQSREAGRPPLCPGHSNSPEPRKTWLDIVWLHYYPTVDQNSQVGIPPVASQVKCFLYPPRLGDLPLEERAWFAFLPFINIGLRWYLTL